MLDRITIHALLTAPDLVSAVRKELWPYRTPHIRNSFSDNKQFNVDDSISLAEKTATPRLKTWQEVLGRTNRLLPLIWHGPHWKRRVQQFFYCCVCIRYRGNVSTQPLPSNHRGIFTKPFPSNDKGIYTEPLPSNDRGETHTHRQ
jgi:hypothetical protein